MQTVSDLWKETQTHTLLPESDIEIKVDVTDPDAQADAVCVADSEAFYSDVANVTNGAEKSSQKYATMEPNLWILDGSITIAATQDKTVNGYIGGTLSDSSDMFAVHPVIEINFSEIYSALIPGITIEWSNTYGEYAKHFIVNAYHGQWRVSYIEVTNNTSVVSPVEVDIRGYDRITIEVLEWSNPYRRARIENISLGLVWTYGKSDIIQFTQSMSVDPLSAELPKSEISVSLKNLDGQYNPFNPQGIARYLMQRQQVTVRYGYYLNGNSSGGSGETVEWIHGGTFYMSEWETPQNGLTFQFKARDLLEYMTEQYTGQLIGRTFAQIANDALEQADLPLLPSGDSRWILDDSLETLYPPEDIHGDFTLVEILQYVANAASCVLYQDRYGIIHISKLVYENNLTDYVINQFNSYSNPELTLTKQLKTVNINNGQYSYAVGIAGEEQSVSNPFITTDNAAFVAGWVGAYLVNRQYLSGDYRADPRLDPLDVITNESQFANVSALITDVTYTYNGAFRGSYTAKPVSTAGVVYFYSGMKLYPDDFIQAGEFPMWREGNN